MIYAAAVQIKAISAQCIFAVSSGCSPREQDASPKLWIPWRGSQNVGMGGRTGAIGRQISFTACSKTSIKGSSLYLVLCNKQTQTTSPGCSQALAQNPDRPEQWANGAGRPRGGQHWGSGHPLLAASQFQGTEPPLPLQIPRHPGRQGTLQPPPCMWSYKSARSSSQEDDFLKTRSRTAHCKAMWYASEKAKISVCVPSRIISSCKLQRKYLNYFYVRADIWIVCF